MLGDIGVEFFGALLVAATFGLAGVVWRASGAPWRVRQWWQDRDFRQLAPVLVEQQGAYQAHYAM